MKRILLGTFLTLFGLGMLASGIQLIIQPPTINFYEGTVVFNTEEEYIQFKQALAQPDVNIYDILALSSSPPIIVKFNVSVPAIYDFPFGRKTDPLPGFSVMALIGFSAIPFALGFNILRERGR